MILMFLAWTVTSSVYDKTQDVKTSGYPQIVFIWLFFVFYAIAWSGLLVACSLEKLPHHWNLSLIYTIWIFVELLFVYFFYVETRGPTLEKMAKILDGENAAVAHVDLHEVEKDVEVQEKGPTMHTHPV
ncbi:hypothetical protein NUU61_006850 [Penicillium alfredii]|uniref:Uncharacterized protein n=1 Tax=Penicillium alfredii TaxID=1506179 RepID=A0A9W9K407_9EURO|nr:uncharacterized protein NUU61_006850 [Penicillium alfredii]KAJ5091980.1 hypothetical protein NUU61_006850 [Penicillium alfredii]